MGRQKAPMHSPMSQLMCRCCEVGVSQVASLRRRPSASAGGGVAASCCWVPVQRRAAARAAVGTRCGGCGAPAPGAAAAGGGGQPGARPAAHSGTLTVLAHPQPAAGELEEALAEAEQQHVRVAVLLHQHHRLHRAAHALRLVPAQARA